MSEVGNRNDPGETFDLSASLSHLLHRAQQLAANASSEKLREAGITLRQFSVLAAASRSKSPSQSRLVTMTGIDRSTLADMLNRMERGGLIARTPSRKDARAKSVALTARGRAALEVAAPAVRTADDALIATLAKNRRSGFLDLLGALIDARSEPSETPAAKASPEKEKPRKKKSKAKGKDKKKSKKKAKS